MAVKTESDMARFNRSVLKTSCGCWIWLKAAGRRGANGHCYGQFSTGSRTDKSAKTVMAHRWIYEQTHGPIPDGMIVGHACDIPECVNPDHLWIGTVQDNVNDMRAKGRDNYTGTKTPYKGPKPWSAKLTAGKVRQMRRLFATGKWTKAALAEKFGVHRVTVIGILRGDFWTHV